MKFVAIVGLIVGLVLAGMFVFWLVAHGLWLQDYARFEANCFHTSGHVYHMEGVASFCLTSDGRMLEVGP